GRSRQQVHDAGPPVPRVHSPSRLGRDGEHRSPQALRLGRRAATPVAKEVTGMSRSPLSIGFFDAGLEFSGMTDIAEQSLGGSETALYYMARHLAARGHQVSVCCKAGKKTGKSHGVVWYDHSQWGQLAATTQFDVFIVNRAAWQFNSRVMSNMNVLWC